MTVRRLRAIGTLACCLAATWCPIGATTVGAATDGACAGSQGVTVVVDFTDLGGDVVVRCAGVLTEPHGTGFDALAAAGFTAEQPIRTPGFVCRIDGRPAAGADACVDTPPPSAYWSYWTASRGGTWQYSALGAAARRVAPGGVEGWSFAKDRAAGSVPAPRVAPPPAPVSTTVPGPASPATTAPATRPPTPTAPPPAGARVGGVTATRPGTPTPTVTTPTGEPAAVPTTALDSATTTTVSGATTTSTPPDRVEVAAAGSAASGGDRDDGGGGSGALTALVVVVIAALAAGAVTTARRRASRLDDASTHG